MNESACPTNLGPRGRRQRLIVALLGTVLLAGGLVWLLLEQPPPSQRWVFAVPLFVIGLGLFQALAGT